MVKNPSLKYRYAVGLGDIIACFLHSKLVSWLTVLLTGKKEPCVKCSRRIAALNVLIPIPFWKLFFDSETELLEELAAEYRAQGYKVKLAEDGKTISVQKATITYDN